MSLPFPEITRLLAEAVGSEHVSSSPVDTTSHALDYWPRALIATRTGDWPCGPNWVVWPGAAAEVSHVLRIAASYAIPVIPYGGGSSMVGGAAPRGDRPWIVINSKRMCNILDMDEVSMVVHVQTGIVGVELEERLNARGFSLGHVPTSMTTATLGGWLSTQSVGLLSSRYGRAGDLCLGITAVLPDGQVVHTRVAPRRATGPELMHLLVGSEGTLGVITAAHLRLHRLPLHRQFDSYRFSGVEPAVAAMRGCLVAGVRPLVARIQQDVRVRRELEGKERGIPASAEPQDPAARVLIMSFEGPPELVDTEREIMRDLATAAGGEALGPAPARRWWGQRFAAAFRLGALLAQPGTFADQVEVGATWRDLPRVHQRLVETLTGEGWHVQTVIEHARLEGACISCFFWGDVGDLDEALRCYDAAWRHVAQACADTGGRLGHVFGAGQHRAELLDDAARHRLTLLTQVKRKLDPAGIMNPGVLGTEP
ncbi:MAG: FAD-binding oxidoreductase [bacterium]